jgi:tetratricopeptide (TPR) repeat protein
MSVKLGLAALAAVCLTYGCASAESRFGHEARYVPAYRGYVVAHPDANVQGTLFLLDPVTQKKIRCREELEPWLRMVSDEEPERIRDENAQVRSLLLMLPATTVVAAAIDVAAPFYMLSQLPYRASKSASADSLFERAVLSFRDEDFADARVSLENALYRDPISARANLTLLYLGMTYEKEDKHDMAARTYEAFVTQATAADESAYDNAEHRFERLRGAPLASCRSQEPVRIHWRKP